MTKYDVLPFPATLDLEVTTLCNSNCVTCPNKKVSRADVMDLREFRALILSCRDRGVVQVSLSLYGEPLLDPYIVERIDFVRRTLGPQVQIGFFTNASLLNEGNSRAIIRAGLTHINFSIDGATKEGFEGVRRGLDFHDVVVRTENFVHLNISLGGAVRTRVHMTATKETLHEVEDFRQYWLDTAGVDEVSWLPCDGRGKEGRAPAIKDDSVVDPCFQPFGNLNVLSNGIAVMCCQDYNARRALGNVFADSVDAIWNAPPLVRIRELHNAGLKGQIALCSECKTRY